MHALRTRSLLVFFPSLSVSLVPFCNWILALKPQAVPGKYLQLKTVA